MQNIISSYLQNRKASHIAKLKERIKKQEETIKRLQKHADYYRGNPPVNRYLRFSRLCHERAEALKADVYSAHGVQALPAASSVSREVGGQVFCDVIEIPSFFERAVAPIWHPTNTTFLDRAFEGYLRHANGLITVGWTLKSHIDHYGPKVSVIPNYRYAEELCTTDRLREMCGISDQEYLVLSVGTLASCVEQVLHALTELPERVHFVSLGRLVPEKYMQKVMEMIRSLRLEGRVHLLDQVPYSELTSVASGADVGLIIRDPSIRNNMVSLPNRVFDYLFSGIPIISPNIPDIKKVIRDYDCGEVTKDTSPGGWSDAINKVMTHPEYSNNALCASKVKTWESLSEKLHNSFGYAERIAFFGFNDLTKNNRTMRMARTLIERGVKVTICCPKQESVGSSVENGVHYEFLPAC